MQINETKEKRLKIADATLHTATNIGSFSKEHLTSLNMGNDQEEETEADPTFYLTAREAIQWRQLPKSKQQEYIKQGMEEAKQSEKKKNSIFEEEPKETATEYTARTFREKEERTEYRAAAQMDPDESSTDPYSSKSNETEGGIASYNSFSMRYQEEKELLLQSEAGSYRQNGGRRQYTKRGSTVRSVRSAQTAQRTETAANESRIVAAGNQVNRATGSRTITATRSQAAAETGSQAIASVGRQAGASAGAAAASSAVPVAGAAVSVGKKTADKFKNYMQEKAMATEQAMQDVEKRMEAGREANHAMDTLPAVVKYTASTVGAVLVSIAAVFAQAVLSLSTMAIAAVIAVFLPLIAIIATVMTLIGLLSASVSTDPAGYGMPSFVTEEMMQAFFYLRKKKGYRFLPGLHS